jgi:hypothetical protein
VDDDFDRLCRRLYVGARDGEPDCTDSFDLATAVLAARPDDRDAAELASLSIEGVTTNLPRMVELTRKLFELGLSEEPGRLAALDDAMRLVNDDLTASGLPHGRLRFLDSGYRVDDTLFAESWDGTLSTSAGVPSSAGAGPLCALLAVADDAQDAVVHTIWSAWPVCPVHRVGTDPREHDAAAVWWCSGDGGHAASKIGAWPGR